MNVFYLGPAGTFTHDAAQMYFTDAARRLFEPCGTPTDVMHRLTVDGNAFGVVPIENSIYGEVIPTLDALCFEFADIFVVGEVSLPISFNWYANNADANPSTVISHPHALAQCKRFLSSRGLVEQTASSTAEACRIVSERDDTGLSAIASPTAGALFGLYALQTGVEDYLGAHTRFLVLGNHLAVPEGANRTMLALLPPNERGRRACAVYWCICAGRFKHFRQFTIVRYAQVLGNYLFIMTVEGSGADGGARIAMERLLAEGYGVKLLGIYKAWSGDLPAAPWPHLPGLLDAQAYERMIDVTKRPC